MEEEREDARVCVCVCVRVTLCAQVQLRACFGERVRVLCPRVRARVWATGVYVCVVTGGRGSKRRRGGTERAKGRYVSQRREDAEGGRRGWWVMRRIARVVQCG